MYDVIVIGGGPAGYSAAKRASEHGAKVVLIEKYQLGGTCLSKGCIPAKYLLHSLKIGRFVRKSNSFKLPVDGIKADIEKLNRNMVKLISDTQKGIAYVMKNSKVDVVRGDAKFISKKAVKVGNRKIEGKYIIIAVGTKIHEVGILKSDGEMIIDSDDALYITEVPYKSLVVGGGFVGVEIATIFAGLGSGVTIVEKENQLMPGWDRELVGELVKGFTRRGVKVVTSTLVSEMDVIDEMNSKVEFKGENTGSAIVDKIVLCLGRKPDIDGLELGNAAIKVKDGAIVVDNRLRTSRGNIFCAGDARFGSKRFAYTAEEEGVIAADNVCGVKSKLGDYHVPCVLFSMPELGTVGKTESELRGKNIKYKKGKAMFAANPRASMDGERGGWVKALTDGKRLIGVQVCGTEATEIVNIAAVIIKSGISVKEINRALFVHPGFGESLYEAIKNSIRCTWCR